MQRGQAGQACRTEPNQRHYTTAFSSEEKLAMHLMCCQGAASIIMHLSPRAGLPMMWLHHPKVPAAFKLPLGLSVAPSKARHHIFLVCEAVHRAAGHT